MDASTSPDWRGSSAHRPAQQATSPQVLMLVDRDSARNRALAERLRREACVTVDIVRTDLEATVDIALVDGRLQGDGRIRVLANNTGVTFMVAFPGRRPSHAS